MTVDVSGQISNRLPLYYEILKSILNKNGKKYPGCNIGFMNVIMFVGMSMFMHMNGTIFMKMPMFMWFVYNGSP